MFVPKFKSFRVGTEAVDDDDAEVGEAGATSSAVAAAAEAAEVISSFVGAAGASANSDLDLFLLPPCCCPFWAAKELMDPVWGMTYGVLRGKSGFCFCLGGGTRERGSEVFPHQRKKEKKQINKKTHADCPTHTGSTPSVSSILSSVRQYLTAVDRLLSSVAATAVAESVLEKPMQRKAK